jgi:hypothetical protein
MANQSGDHVQTRDTTLDTPTSGHEHKPIIEHQAETALVVRDKRATLQCTPVNLDNLKDRIVNGEQVEDLLTQLPAAYKYRRTLRAIQDVHNRSVKRTEKTDAFWIWGPNSETLRKHIIHEVGAKSMYVQDSSFGGWWDNYSGQELVLIDADTSKLPLHIIVKAADKWPFAVARRRKCPYPFTSKAIIVASHQKPEDTYRCAEDLQRLYRKIKVFEVKADGSTERTLLQEPREDQSPELPCSSVGTRILQLITSIQETM